MRARRTPTWIVLACAALASCARVASAPGSRLAEPAALVKQRSGLELVYDELGPESRDASPAVRSLLAGGLTAERAVAIALMANREIQALYSDLGVTDSDLVQARLLHNPVLSAGAGVPVAGGAVDMALGLALDVVDLLYVPLRERVAAPLVEETKLRVAGEVLDLAWRTRTAFLRHQASTQMVGVRQSIVEATSASAETTRRLRAAGNVTDLAVASEEAFEAAARLDLRLAEIAARESREELNQRMGLWGRDADWALASARLPDPADAPEVEHVESRAVAASLDLAMASRRKTAAAAQVELASASGLFPEILFGSRGDRTRGEWTTGPSLALALPIFDRGEARAQRAEAELRRAREVEYALAVHVRAAARSIRDRVVGQRERALYYRDVALPLRSRVVQQTGLQYNAMQLGPVELLRAKQQEVEAGLGYVEALRDYWLAESDLALLFAGRLPATPTPALDPSIDSPRRSPIPNLG